jgi:hypothetical protein
MSEKPESDEFEEEDAEDAAPGGDDVDVDHIMRDVESQRRRAPKGAEPAWRRLERVMEERRTAELMSDFDDYEIADADADTADADADTGDDEEIADGEDSVAAQAPPAHAEKPARKKKKAR